MSARELCRSLGETLREARRAAADGARLDLAGLDGEVGRLCTLAQAIPDAEQEAMRVAIAALIGELDGLTSELARQQRPAARDPARAARAYRPLRGGS